MQLKRPCVQYIHSNMYAVVGYQYTNHVARVKMYKLHSKLSSALDFLKSIMDTHSGIQINMGAQYINIPNCGVMWIIEIPENIEQAKTLSEFETVDLSCLGFYMEMHLRCDAWNESRANSSEVKK